MAKASSWYNVYMNKIITKTVKYRGKEVSVDQLKQNSSIKVLVECKHGQRKVRWNRRHQLCRKCVSEAGLYNTCKKGRKITWGDKISKAKKGINLTEEHKKALLESRINKICKKKGISREEFQGFPTKGEQFKLRNYTMKILSRSAIEMSIEDQDKLTKQKLGYTAEELKKHLESQFQEGMTWDNYGEWHIDHSTPESWFVYNSPEDEDFKKCWALSNLQPMWAKQNIEKQNKYSGKHRPKKFYMLAGQFGVGKTTLCKDLDSKFTTISYDDFNMKKLDSFISNNYFNDKPILLDIPVHITTVYKRYTKKGYEIELITLIESKDIIIERLIKRGGTINENNINRRYSRIQSIKDNYAKFSGTYEEVLSYLHNLEI